MTLLIFVCSVFVLFMAVYNILTAGSLIRHGHASWSIGHLLSASILIVVAGHCLGWW